MPKKGYKQTTEHTEKARAAKIGYHQTEETRLKMSIAKMGIKNPMYKKTGTKHHMFGKPGPMLGKKHTIETKQKLSEGKVKNKNPNWKNGTMKNRAGYILKLKHEHPFASRAGYIMEHKLVMEKHLGRYLKPEEQVHHINGVKDDNRIENLMLFKNHSDHVKYHHYLRKFLNV